MYVGPREPRLPVWGQEELKPGGLRGGGPRGCRVKAGSVPEPLPVPLSVSCQGPHWPLLAEFQLAREPGDAHAALQPGAGKNQGAGENRGAGENPALHSAPL